MVSTQKLGYKLVKLRFGDTFKKKEQEILHIAEQSEDETFYILNNQCGVVLKFKNACKGFGKKLRAFTFKENLENIK